MIRSGGDGSSARKGGGSSAPATASSLADLGDRGHVHSVAEAPGQPVNLAVAGRYFCRRRAVVSSKAVPAGEPGNVTDLTDDDGGDDRSRAEDLGQGGT